MIPLILFSTPVKIGKVRKNVNYELFGNGMIVIEGHQFVMYSISEAKRIWCKKNPAYRK